MTATYTNDKGQNYRAGTLDTNADVLQLAQLLTWGFVGIQLTGSWTGTITFEASVDGTTFVALPVTPIAGGATVTSATINGIWYVQNTGFRIIRVRATAAMTGSTAVSFASLPSQI